MSWNFCENLIACADILIYFTIVSLLFGLSVQPLGNRWTNLRFFSFLRAPKVAPASPSLIPLCQNILLIGALNEFLLLSSWQLLVAVCMYVKKNYICLSLKVSKSDYNWIEYDLIFLKWLCIFFLSEIKIKKSNQE